MAQTPFAPRTIPVGANQLLLTDEAFLNGYQAGHLAYLAHDRATRFSDTSLRKLLLAMLDNLDFPEAYRFGFVVGWLLTFARSAPPDHALA